MQEGSRHERFRLAVNADLGVQTGHGRAIDAPFQAVNRLDERRGPLLEIGPIKDHGMVRRKVVQVVFQHAETVDDDFGVGGVDIGHVELAGAQAAIGQGMIDHLEIRLRQLVAALQSRPAVLAFHEFVAQAEAEIGVLHEVGNLANAQSLGVGFAHRQGVGVVKPQLAAHADVLLGQDSFDLHFAG